MKRRGKKIECVVPASGLVTALEPVLKACGGTWIAHGSGDADREVVDAQNKIRVPPEEPQYVLKRVWLTKEEEKGYYYGFSNEGLWPLCHITHTRPSFRAEDWGYYQTVNKKFAQATLEELRGRRRTLNSDPGLSFCPAPSNDQRRAPGCPSGSFLAHPLAESRILQHLPLAEGTSARHVGRRPHRLSHPVSL